MLRYGIIFLLGLGALLVASAVQARTENATLDVSAIVPTFCTLANPALSLGTVDGRKAGKVIANTTIEITCAADVPYRITLGDGSPVSLKPAAQPGGKPIPYTVHFQQVTALTDGRTVERLGTGASDPLAIQASINLLGNEVAGRYEDTLAVTIDW